MNNVNVAVVTASEARERDSRAIASGTPSAVLMHNAGLGAAAVIVRRYRDILARGVEVYAGPGNNGGDGWVVAGELARLGIPVRVVESAAPRSPDAIEAKRFASSAGFQTFEGEPGLVIDALLGTGSVGAPNGEIAQGVNAINAAHTKGATVIALDIPTGLDATSGEHGLAVQASATITFGTVKRGQLVARDLCGEISVIDIGLDKHGSAAKGDIMLASGDWVLGHVPGIGHDAHKGTRKRLAIVAGDAGMAGAAILAAKAALRSGIGLLHLVVAEENRDAVHCAVPSALVSTHDEFLAEPSNILAAANAIVVGPGVQPENAKRFLEALTGSTLPVVLDAGALTDLKSIEKFSRGRELVLTPHPAEMGRMLGRSTADVLAHRFEIGGELASRTGATVLLKGTPTIVSSSSGSKMVSATGTPALATGGSGDLLSGIIGTLLAQTKKGFDSAVCSAWVHGRAAELCGTSRGITLDDILYSMPTAWSIPANQSVPPVLTSLPAIQ